MTGAPVGMGMEKDVGAKRVGVNLSFFLPALLNAPEKGIPTSLQVMSMCPLGLKRVPSAKTVCEEKKFTLSCPMMGIMMKAPTKGMCWKVISTPLVSDTPRFRPLILTLLPRKGI